MRRGALLAALALVILAAAVVGTAVLNGGDAGLPIQAQARLDEYLEYAFRGRAVVVSEIDRATHPSALTDGMIGRTYGGSVHFQTDLGALDIEAGSLAPLPFPPVEVWCVLLQGAEPPAGRIALVALHENLYNADWIVHEGPGDASSVAAQHLLSTLGCTLGSEPDDFDALDRVKQDGQ